MMKSTIVTILAVVLMTVTVVVTCSSRQQQRPASTEAGASTALTSSKSSSSSSPVEVSEAVPTSFPWLRRRAGTNSAGAATVGDNVDIDINPLQNQPQSESRRLDYRYGGYDEYGCGKTLKTDLADPDGGPVKGNVEFSCSVGWSTNGGLTAVDYSVTGLTPGLHGFHVHEFKVGTNGDPSCMSTGGHYNPEGTIHGSGLDYVRHIGAMGNILADEDGKAEGQLLVAMPLSGPFGIQNGTAVVVHANTDDLGLGGANDSRANGNSGPRVACGNLRDGGSNSCQTIAEIACDPSQADTFSILCNFASQSGVAEVLGDESQTLTVFAPTNAAFENAPPITIAQLESVLLFHAVAGRALMMDDLVCKQTVGMANGRDSRTICDNNQNPTIMWQRGAANVDSALPQINSGDIKACNGVIHVVDNVMLQAGFVSGG